MPDELDHSLNERSMESRLPREENDFFRPGIASRRLAILETLSRDTTTTQKSLAEQANMSGAMVNTYIKDLQSRGLITFQAVNGKQYHYQLTRQGEAERRRLLLEYYNEIVDIYESLAERISTKLSQDLPGREVKLALYGATKVCQAVFSSLAQERRCRIVALVDDDRGLQGQSMQGFTVSPPDILYYLAFDCLLMTSLNHSLELPEQVRRLKGKKDFQTLYLNA